MCNKINHLAYNQKLCIVLLFAQMNSIIKNLVKSIAYINLNVRLWQLEDIVNEIHLRLQKGLLGMGFAKLSTSGGMGTDKQLRTKPTLKIAQLQTNSHFNIAQSGVPYD